MTVLHYSKVNRTSFPSLKFYKSLRKHNAKCYQQFSVLTVSFLVRRECHPFFITCMAKTYFTIIGLHQVTNNNVTLYSVFLAGTIAKMFLLTVNGIVVTSLVVLLIINIIWYRSLSLFHLTCFDTHLTAIHTHGISISYTFIIVQDISIAAIITSSSREQVWLCYFVAPII